MSGCNVFITPVRGFVLLKLPTPDSSTRHPSFAPSTNSSAALLPGRFIELAPLPLVALFDKTHELLQMPLATATPILWAVFVGASWTSGAWAGTIYSETPIAPTTIGRNPLVLGVHAGYQRVCRRIFIQSRHFALWYPTQVFPAEQCDCHALNQLAVGLLESVSARLTLHDGGLIRSEKQTSASLNRSTCVVEPVQGSQQRPTAP